MDFKHPVTIRGELGGGGFGQLLRCLDAAGRRFVAKFPKDYSPQNQAMVKDEERRLRRWQGKYIVRYLGPVQHSDGRTGYAMEEMDESLAAVLARGALSEVAALEHIRGAAAGLLEVHGSGPGAFHGDVKPGNILVCGGVTKLADFGLARGGYGQTIMAGPHTGGTPGYMPPEGYSSPAGDVYSLGATLAALLTGSEAGSSVSLPTDLTPALISLLRGMMDSDPQQRTTMEQVVGWLPGVIDAVKVRRANMMGDILSGIAIILALLVALPLLVASAAKGR